jgi:hypothetical protein
VQHSAAQYGVAQAVLCDRISRQLKLVHFGESR